MQQNAVDPFAYVDRVVPTQSKGVSRSVGNIVSRIGGCAAVVAQETGIRVSVASVEGKVGDRIGDRGFGPEAPCTPSIRHHAARTFPGREYGELLVPAVDIEEGEIGLQ